ncbi:MAG TPA: carbon storage regulator [Pirellulales bacterium]|jgi:carbon storage regulator CsrA
MLVLTRKTREQIQIGENVVVTILRVKGQSVRVGIEAPRDVRVLRSELPIEEPMSQPQATESTETTGRKTGKRTTRKTPNAPASESTARTSFQPPHLPTVRRGHSTTEACATPGSPLATKLAARTVMLAEVRTTTTTNRLLHAGFEPASAALG